MDPEYLLKLEQERAKIRHDCMWSGSSLWETSQSQEIFTNTFDNYDSFNLNEFGNVEEESMFNLMTTAPDLDCGEEPEDEDEQESEADGHESFANSLTDNILQYQNAEHEANGNEDFSNIIDNILVDQNAEYEDVDFNPQIDDMFDGDFTEKIDLEVLEGQIDNIFYGDPTLKVQSDHSYAAPCPIAKNSPTLQSQHSSSTQQQSLNCFHPNFSSAQQEQSPTSPPRLPIVSRGKPPLQFPSYHRSPRKPCVKRTQIVLVPVHELVENLKQKNFKVSDIRPGVKVVRLFNGETVRQILGFKEAHRAVEATQVSVSSGSSSKLSRKEPRRIRKPKKETHKPKQELPPITPKKNLPSNISSSKRSDGNLSSTKANVQKSIRSEQLRRVDLRNNFESLRKLVPTLNTRPRSKSSKIEILNHTKQYIYDLKQEEKRLLSMEQDLARKHADLKHKIAFLNNGNKSHYQ